MEDLPERSTTQPQAEEQPAEVSAEAAGQAEGSPSNGPEPAEKPTGPETPPLAEPQAEDESPAEAPKSPDAPPAAPPRPAKPVGPRMAELRPGSVVEGKVTRIERYGAFVNLGLVEKRDGLIHISELAPYRIRRVEDVVRVGDEVRARVVSVDLSRGRIALSLNDVDTGEYKAEAASTSNEPTLTAMAMAFERAYGRLREREAEGKPGSARNNQGDKKRREQEMLMEKFRSSNP
ncbi:MAG: S1 RNA-binding domain-containing protein [Sphingomonadaceae bacterium]